jgi:hypothetical protein
MVKRKLFVTVGGKGHKIMAVFIYRNPRNISIVNVHNAGVEKIGYAWLDELSYSLFPEIVLVSNVVVSDF